MAGEGVPSTGAGSTATTETFPGLDRFPTKSAAAGPWFGCFPDVLSRRSTRLHHRLPDTTTPVASPSIIQLNPLVITEGLTDDGLLQGERLKSPLWKRL